MNRSKWLFRAVWLIALIPLVVAWSLAFFGSELGYKTKNHGELTPHGIFVPTELMDSLDGKWGLLVLSQQCEELCRNQLYRMQQLHTAMGRDFQRLQPIWLAAQQPAVMPAELDLKQVKTVTRPALVNWFSEQKLAWQDHSIWVIDPSGVVVMRFAPDLSGKQILSDIDWLLKASHIG